ncbi:hypothetical protein [Chryseobacterium sp. c4a]|uniref:hypothetical protein n=1 Tax=Chryseobacterium sp. c4a TaxID=1573582 RepID=UPI001359C90A|nr:hypothetical protein [Chryseobacterium sp. c4a]
MKKKTITLGTILFLNIMVQSQYTPKVLPPSPNATSLAKFVESPISYYRGSANVNIPLFNIDSGDFPLNVSIQYDTKGILVGEIASAVGAGWSLNAGGLITRQVRQRPDENQQGYLTYNYNATFQTDVSVRQAQRTIGSTYSDSSQPLDEDPDLYIINFLGKSGKFIIDNVTKKAVVQGFEDWQVKIDYVNINAFDFAIDRITITDELGNQYFFGQDEARSNPPAYDIVNSSSSKLLGSGEITANEDNYRTAWHLKEIKTLKHRYAFNYKPETVDTYSKTDLKKNLNEPLNMRISMGTNRTTQQRLQNIYFPDGQLDLEYYTTVRQDLKGGYALKSLTLKKIKKTENQVQPYIKKIELLQNYREGDLDHTNIESTILTIDNKGDNRLFLNQINEVEQYNNDIISSYKFEYNPRKLPNRHSNSVDYWGYYNGRPNYKNIFDNVSDRNVYAEAAEAGILTKITYPTGGTESFYYENNSSLIPNHLMPYIYPAPSSNNFVGGGRRILRIETNDNTKITKRKFNYNLEGGVTSGKLLGIPDYLSVMAKYGSISVVIGQISNRIQPLSSFNNAGQVGYSQVTESFLSADDSVLWSKKYKYTNYLDGGEYYRYPYHIPDDMGWARGLNTEITAYDFSGKPVERLQNFYSFSETPLPYRFYMQNGTLLSNTPKSGFPVDIPPAQVPADYLLSHDVKSIPMYKPGKYWEGTSPTPAELLDVNLYRTAFFYGGMTKNYQKIKTEYENGLPVKITTIDTANESLNHHQITFEKTTYSDGISQETSYQYASEKGNQKLLNANMVGIPLETEVKKNNKTLSRIETKYDDPANLFPTSVISYDIQAQVPSTEITYDKYDSKGNLQQYTTSNGMSTVIIWGYKNTRPIAKIENAKLENIPISSITAIVTASDEDGYAMSGSNEIDLLNALTTFRNSLSNYQITTYTYDPLVGVRSVTPPTGIREVYIYDSSNRLMEIREDNQTGNLLKEFNYHYKN